MAKRVAHHEAWHQQSCSRRVSSHGRWPPISRRRRTNFRSASLLKDSSNLRLITAWHFRHTICHLLGDLIGARLPDIDRCHAAGS